MYVEVIQLGGMICILWAIGSKFVAVSVRLFIVDIMVAEGR